MFLVFPNFANRQTHTHTYTDTQYDYRTPPPTFRGEGNDIVHLLVKLVKFTYTCTAV